MKTLLLACGLLLASCTTPGGTYVQADRDTFDAIAPEYRIYVQADPSLSVEQRDRRLLLIELWDKRIRTVQGEGR